MEKQQTIFKSTWGNYLVLVLTVDITKKNDYYILESKKFRLKIKSSTLGLNEAKKEFSDAFNEIIFHLMKTKNLFKTLEFLGFKKQPLNEIMKVKNNTTIQNNKNNKLGIDMDIIMGLPPMSMIRTEPSNDWNAEANS